MWANCESNKTYSWKTPRVFQDSNFMRSSGAIIDLSNCHCISIDLVNQHSKFGCSSTKSIVAWYSCSARLFFFTHGNRITSQKAKHDPLSSGEVPWGSVFRMSAREHYWRIGKEKSEHAGISGKVKASLSSPFPWFSVHPVLSLSLSSLCSSKPLQREKACVFSAMQQTLALFNLLTYETGEIPLTWMLKTNLSWRYCLHFASLAYALTFLLSNFKKISCE